MSQPARKATGIPFAAGNPGRPPGFPNRTTVSVKAALEAAFLGLGGVPALIAWGEKEPAEFYRLWGKLLPRNVTIEGGAQLGIVILPPLGSPTATATASIGSVDGLERLEPIAAPLPALEASSGAASGSVGAAVGAVGAEL